MDGILLVEHALARDIMLSDVLLDRVGAVRGLM